ncbi:MAG: EI24 domain-containing protein [Chitinophagaceae bacterium]|nr:EI24 domain-containing protein [Chitinophagaceae bacterium]
MLKEIVTAIQSYFRAHQFLSRHKLWKWILIPGIIYMLLFAIGMYFFFITSDNAVNYLSDLFGINRWLQQQKSALLNFIFVMSSFMLRLILLFFFFSLFKYLFLIVGSPVFAYLSEKTAAILEGKEYPFSFGQLFKDIVRGITLSVRNMLWQAVYIFCLILLAFIPLVGWITPLIALLVECYFYGFSMLDYSCERHKLSPSASVSYISRHKGLAIGNGLVFYFMHLIPILGWIVAPAYAVVAATLSLYYQQKEI